MERRDNGEGGDGREGVWFSDPMFMLEDSLGESLATVTPVGAAFPIKAGHRVSPLALLSKGEILVHFGHATVAPSASIPS